MPEIIPHIYKSKVSKDWHNAVKYSDIESCFLGRSADDIFIYSFFGGTQAYSKEKLEQIEVEGGYKLVHMRFHPDPSWPYGSTNANTPWLNRENPIVIRVYVYAIPRSTNQETKLSRIVLKNVIAAEVRKLTPKKWTNEQWRLDVDLLSAKRLIECTSQVWTGLRPGPEVKTIVLLEESRTETV